MVGFDLVAFGERLRSARRAHGWTQQELGERVRMDSTQISHRERGDCGVSMRRLYELCRALGVSADYLLGLDG